MQYIWSILLAMVLLVSCEETLPKFEVTTIKVKAEWKNADLYLTTDMDLASGVEVLEQGFVLGLPVYNYSWTDNPDWLEKRTVTVPVGTTAYTFPSEGWAEGLNCTVYAYVKTNSGNYRSWPLELKTPEPPAPKFVNVTLEPGINGPWYGGGTLIIEGENFYGNIGNVSVYVENYELEIAEGGSGRIIAKLPGFMFNHVGEYAVKVKISGHEYALTQKMVIDGIRILSVEPEHPRHGELVKMNIQKPVPGSILEIATDIWQVKPEVLEETDEYIIFRMPEYPAEKFEFSLADQFAVWSKPFTVEVGSSWKELELDPAIWNGQSLDVNTLTYHAGKTYISNADHTALMVFDPATTAWQKVPYPDIPSGNQWFHQVKMCGWNDYLYLYVCNIRDASMEGGFMNWQYLYRLDLNNGQWTLVGKHEDAEPIYKDVDLTATEEGVLYITENGHNPDYYMTLMEYHLTDKTWKESDYDLPSGVDLIGSRGNVVYYQAGGDFYAVNIGEGSQAELVLDMPVWVHYPVVSDEYLYYSIDESVICRVRLGVPGAEEERLGVPNAEGTRLILPDAEQPCCIVQDAYGSMKFYQYILR